MVRAAYYILEFLFLAVLSIHLSQAAVGISPGSYTIDFTPGLKQQFTFEFLGDNDAELEIYAAGDLAKYVKLSNERIKGNGGVSVLLTLPDEIDTPGDHIIYIGARQIAANGGGGFGIVGNVKGVINVIVPYPGQYALLRVTAENVNVGDPVKLTAYIDNLGSQQVSASTTLDIYNGKSFITGLDFGSFELKSPEKKTIVESLETTNYVPGNYQVFGMLEYGDGLVAESNTTFRLGELKLDIVNYTKILERNKINRFEIRVESNWNNPIDEVYADVNIEGYSINFKTPAAHVDSFGVTTLTGFFDTTGMQNKTINARIKVNYSGRTTEEIVTLSFRKERDYLIIGLIAAVIVIALLVITVSYMLRRTEKKRR